MAPDPQLVERFSRDLDTLAATDSRIGVAVSGGPDSLALLLLAAAARPGLVEAATVDHRFRPEARGEAEFVASVCERLGVPHVILTARWEEKPETAIQERARDERYRLLGYWAEERGLNALATAHQADDQAETVLMRLARGSGVRGLAGIRPRSVAPGSHVRLIRPLLAWRRAELEHVCAQGGLTPVVDPSNDDPRFERVRVRRSVAGMDWLDSAAVAASAAHLAEADAALDWAARAVWDRAVERRRGAIFYRPDGIPTEISRRIVARAIRKLASEGESVLRGAELERLIASLAVGATATIRGVLCSGGAEWRFAPAPPRSA
jgi:tRNA(Ile)-lysidine synthase